MKKVLIVLITALILFSGCVGQNVVKEGDNISVYYVGRLQDGKVFDTNIEKVAKENNLYVSGKTYDPLTFTVGKGEMIQGFDKGVLGIKEGDTKTITIPPEEAYGEINPQMVQVYPVIQVEPTRYPRFVEIPVEKFYETYGQDKKIGDIITIPGSGINLTVVNLAQNASLSYNFKVGDLIPLPGAPWNLTVVKLDDKNFTVEYSVKKNQTIQFGDVPWNTTVIDVTGDNITLRHNAIPDTVIPSMFGQVKVSFNETSIIMDQNHELAGKTLVFDITVKSIQ